jgi:LysR family transcriptional regulator for bpeEF and oprC
MKASLDNLFLFKRVAEMGSFHAAAAALAMPVSTLSRRVKQLEAQLQQRLLDRNTRHLRLTHEGDALLVSCSTALEQLSRSVHELESDVLLKSSKLRVTMPTFLGGELLMNWLAEFSAAHSSLQLEIDVSNQYEDLIQQGFDVALRIGPLKNSAYVAQFLHSSQMQFCASQSYLDEHGEPANLEELKQHAFICLKRQRSIELSNGEIFSHPSPLLVANDIRVAREFMMNGRGVACLPDLACRSPRIEAATRRVLNDICFKTSRDIYAVYASRRHVPAATRTFIDELKQYFLSGASA